MTQKMVTIPEADYLALCLSAEVVSNVQLKEAVEAVFRRHIEAAPYAKDLLKRVAFEVVPLITLAGDITSPPTEDKDRVIGNILDRWAQTPSDVKAEMREFGCGQQLDELERYMSVDAPSPLQREGGE